MAGKQAVCPFSLRPSAPPAMNRSRPTLLPWRLPEACIALILAVASGLAAAFSGSQQATAGPPPPASLLASLSLVPVLVLALVFVRSFVSRVSPVALVGLSGASARRIARWLGAGFTIGLVLAAVCGGLASVLQEAFARIGIESAEQASVQWLLDPATPRATRIIVAAYAALVAPVCEELLYRGMLLTAALRIRPNIPVAITVVSILFAMAHGSLVALLPLCLVGVVCALFAVRTGSLLPGIALHATFNFANLALIVALRDTPALP